LGEREREGNIKEKKRKSRVNGGRDYVTKRSKRNRGKREREYEATDNPDDC